MNIDDFDIDDLDLGDGDDDIPIPLPSQRKKNMFGTKVGKKRPPKKQVTTTVINLNDSESDAFGISSDKLSPPPTPAVSTVQSKSIPPSDLDQLEKKLKSYIDKSISAIKDLLVQEISFRINDTKEEDSVINTFILGLPHEIDEIVDQEIRSYHKPDEASVSPIDTSLEVHLELLRKMINVSDVAKPLYSLSPSVIEELEKETDRVSSSIDDFINLPLENYKFERTDLANIQKFNGNNANMTQLPNSMHLNLIEQEATNKQLEIEEELLKIKKQRILDSHETWRNIYESIQTEADDCSGDNVQSLVIGLHNKISQSNLKKSLDSVSKLETTLHNELDNILNLQCQISSEYSRAQRISKRKLRKVYDVIDEDGSDEFLREIKQRIDEVEKQYSAKPKK